AQRQVKRESRQRQVAQRQRRPVGGCARRKSPQRGFSAQQQAGSQQGAHPPGGGERLCPHQRSGLSATNCEMCWESLAWSSFQPANRAANSPGWSRKAGLKVGTISR